MECVMILRTQKSACGGFFPWPTFPKSHHQVFLSECHSDLSDLYLERRLDTNSLVQFLQVPPETLAPELPRFSLEKDCRRNCETLLGSNFGLQID